MKDIAKIIREDNFISALMDSFPCGVLVVDGKGYTRAINNTALHVLGVSKQTIIGKGIGEAIGCIHALENPQGCGFGPCCNDCRLRRLAVNTISNNKKQKGRLFLQVLIKGQVRDITLMLNSTPAIIKNECFAILFIVDIAKLDAFTPIETEDGFRGIVGRDEKILGVFDAIRQAAHSGAPTLIQGETGTGKELVALAIHRESRRARNRFVPVNCGAIPEGLLESELFGHVKGAFTGAICDKKGYFELANEGTIFLDEIGEMSPLVQVKLLRVLQDGRFERVGSEKTIHMDVRVISATNKKLEQEVTAGRFRKDLYYRLCVIPLTLPPLRERRGDIPLLAEYFLSHYTQEPEYRNAIIIPTALAVLMAHSWPGNVRELQNVLQLALIKSEGHLIEPEHLCPPLPEVISSSLLIQNRGQKLNVEDVTKALKKAGGNRKSAAQILGVSRSTLYRFFARQENQI